MGSTLKDMEQLADINDQMRRQLDRSNAIILELNRKLVERDAEITALRHQVNVWQVTGNAIMLCTVGREAPLSDSDVCNEINALRQQVAELQTMHNAVPVNAISRYYYGTMQIDGVYSDDEYNSDSSSIEIWMDGMTD